MADQNSRIDALLDSLSSATSEEIETALRIFEPADVAAVVAKRAGSGSGGGGSMPALTASGTVTKDTPYVHIFDFGAQAFVYVTALATALDGDGETFGAADGDIGVEVQVEVSADGMAFTASSGDLFARNGDPSNELAIAVGDGRADAVVTWRYLRVTNTMYTQPDEDPYVGANDPTADFTLTATYIQT